MNNNFKSNSSASRNGYKSFGSSPMSSSSTSSSFGSANRGFGSSSFNNRGGSSFSGNSFNRTSSMNNRPTSSFGSSNRMGGSSFGTNRGQSGYGLMNSSFSSRPSSMNRPVSVYGKSTGFYFPRDNRRTTTTYRQNDSISFNQNSQILTAPQQTSQDYYEQSYVDPAYADPYANQTYDTTYQETVYQETPVYEEAAPVETVYEETTSVETPVYGSPYQILDSAIQNQAAQSNSATPRGAVLADRTGAVYGEAFNYVDESGTEFDAEQYFLADFAGGAAAGLVVYSNAAPCAEDTLDLIIDSGAEELIIICANDKEVKKVKKDKAFKKAEKTLSKSGLVVDAVVAQ